MNWIFLQRLNQLHPSHLFSLRYCKLVILGTLGMPGYAHPKRYYQLLENFYVYLQCLSVCKKSTSSPMFFWRYCKDITVIPRVFWT